MRRRKIKSYKNVLTHGAKSGIIKVSKERKQNLSGDRNKQRTAREEGKNKQEKQRIKLKRKGEKQNGKELDGI